MKIIRWPIQMKLYPNKKFSLTLLSFIFFPVVTLGQSVFHLEVMNNGNLTQSGSAAMVADNMLLSSAGLVGQGEQWIVNSPETDATLVGTLIVIDVDRDLALLQVNGLFGESVQVAADEAELGRKIALVLVDTIRPGTVHSYLDSPNNSLQIRHTSLLQEGEFAAPLLNNCNELLGISQNPEAGLLSNRLRLLDDFGRVGEVSELKAFLAENEIDYLLATESCLSEAEQLTQARQQAEQQEAELEELLAEQTRVLQEQEELQRQQEDATQQNEELSQEMEQRLAELAQQSVELDEARTTIEVARNTIEEAEAEREELEESQENLEELAQQQEEELVDVLSDIDRTRTNQIYIGSALGIVMLALLGLIVMQVKKRKKLQLEAEQDINKEQKKVASVQADLDKASAEFTDILLVGEDADGKEQRLKLNGNALIRSENGQLVGRSAQDADYVLNLDHISRKHLHVWIEDGNVYVEDLGSVNGTAVNEHDLSPHTASSIQNGDSIRLGLITMKIFIVDN